MEPIQLIQSLYLGDRACKSIFIDGWRDRVIVQVDCLSFLRPGTTTWNYYTGHDIDDALLVFDGVKRFSCTPPGPVPNDYIAELAVSDAGDALGYEFTLEVASVDSKGNSTQVLVRIDAQSFHIEDPRDPGNVITECPRAV